MSNLADFILIASFIVAAVPVFALFFTEVGQLQNSNQPEAEQKADLEQRYPYFQEKLEGIENLKEVSERTRNELNELMAQIAQKMAATGFDQQKLLPEAQKATRKSLQESETITEVTAAATVKQILETSISRPPKPELFLQQLSSISDDPTKTPIPASNRELTDSRYAWYQVEKPSHSDELLPSSAVGDWLLVDTQPEFPNNELPTNQPILLVMDKEVSGGALVRPLDPQQSYQRIYLVSIADMPTGHFKRDEVTGQVAFSGEAYPQEKINPDDVIGVVMGLWKPMTEAPTHS